MTGTTATELRRMIDQVSPHMSEDDTLPVINSVRLEQSDGYLIAVATDRYTMGIARTPVTDDVTWQASIPAVQVKAVASWLKGTSDDIEVTALRGDLLTELTLSGGDGSISICTETADYGTFPRWRTIARAAITAQPEGNVTSYNGKFLARWKTGGSVLHSWQAGHNKPVIFIPDGGQFLGIHMPVRTERNNGDDLAKDWLDCLVPKAEVDGQEYRLDIQWSDEDGDLWEYTNRDTHDRQPWMRIVGFEGDDHTLADLVRQYGPLKPAAAATEAAGDHR